MINPTFDKKEHSKWEYRIYTQYLDDEELKSENDWLNKGGKEGWELVNVIKDKSDIPSKHLALNLLLFQYVLKCLHQSVYI